MLFLQRSGQYTLKEAPNSESAEQYIATLACPATAGRDRDSQKVHRGHPGKSEEQANRLLESEANRRLCRFCILATLSPAEVSVFLSKGDEHLNIDEAVASFRSALDQINPDSFAQ